MILCVNILNIVLMLMSGLGDEPTCFWRVRKGDIITAKANEVIYSTVDRLQKVLGLSQPMIDCQSL